MKVKWQISFLVVCLAVLLLFTVPAFAQTTADVELVGTIEAMTLDTITVNGLLVDVSTAQINTPLEVGALVHVEGTLNVDGSILARQINPADAAIQPGEIEITGTVESLDASMIVVNGLAIDVSSAVVDPAIVVGDMAKVHATVDSAGIWIAREVQLYTPDPAAPPVGTPPPAGEFEITGTLDEIGDGFIIVAGQTITTTGAEIHDTLVVGVLVTAHVQLVEGVLVAREVGNAVSPPVATDPGANDNTNDNANDNEDEDHNDNTNANDNSGVETAITAQDAIDIVLGIYPNTTVIEIQLDSRFGGTLVWVIRTSHGLELTIDAQSGTILTIDQSGNGNSNGNDDAGNNNSSVGDDHGDDHSNSNSNDNHSGDDSGMGSGDDSGMGSDDD